MKYKCIIFDCDGVLVDSEAISAKVFQTMMSELGCDLEMETVLEQITGTSMKENLKFFTDQLGRDLPPDFEKEFRKRSFEAFKTDLKPVPGVYDIIGKLKIPYGVASSGPVNKIKLNLTTTKLIDNFGENIFSSYDIGSWKPEPDIYLYAARKMGFSPGQCAVVEDSAAGVKAAVAGGFDVYAYTTNSQEENFIKLGAKVFYSMKELGNLLNIN